MGNFKLNKFQGDRENATYRHCIVLKQEHRIGKVVELEGYSKNLHHPEDFDKVKAFANYVSRLICSQLFKSTTIEFFTNLRTGKDNDELLCYVTHGSYWLHPKFMNVPKLKDILERAKNGEVFEKKRPEKLIKTKTNMDEYFIYREGLFANAEALWNYCEKLKADGIMPGRVDGYYFDVRQKFNLK